jgi:hypothetical protein
MLTAPTRRLAALLVLAAACAPALAPARAVDEVLEDHAKKRYLATGSLRVAVDRSATELVPRAADASPPGLLVAVGREMGRRLEAAVVFVEYGDRAAMLAGAARGEWDFTVTERRPEDTGVLYCTTGIAQRREALAVEFGMCTPMALASGHGWLTQYAIDLITWRNVDTWLQQAGTGTLQGTPLSPERLRR